MYGIPAPSVPQTAWSSVPPNDLKPTDTIGHRAPDTLLDNPAQRANGIVVVNPDGHDV